MWFVNRRPGIIGEWIIVVCCGRTNRFLSWVG
jgi:hypothetical protein